MTTIHQLLKILNACNDAQDWAKDYNTIEEMVANVHRGDWLLWLAKKVDMDIRPLTLAKARCAKTVIHLMKDERSVNAVKVAERFGLDDSITLEELKAAAADAAYAANAANAVFAANAAYAAANADAADAAAAASAVYAAAASAYDAKIANQKQTADICRETFGELLIGLVNKKLK